MAALLAIVLLGDLLIMEGLSPHPDVSSSEHLHLLFNATEAVLREASGTETVFVRQLLNDYRNMLPCSTSCPGGVHIKIPGLEVQRCLQLLQASGMSCEA